jgi:muramoyltetrapeptide carboxypeptidase
MARSATAKSNEATKPQWFQGLRPGDRVGLVLPSSACSEADFEKSKQWLEKQGYEPVSAPYAELVSGKEIFTANDDETRASNLYRNLSDPSLKAVWAVRGGYGAARLLPFIEQWSAPKNAPLFVGYSDSTVLLNFFAERWNWVTLHAATLSQLAADEPLSLASKNNIADAVLAKTTKWQLPEILPLNETAAHANEIISQVAGGCLSLVASLLGTPYAINCKDKILLLEDIDEAGYRLDRMLTQLKQTADLRTVKAVVFGEMGGYQAAKLRAANDSKITEQNAALKIFAAQLDALSVPVFSSANFGHCAEMLAFPIGAEGKIDTQKQTLTVDKT